MRTRVKFCGITHSDDANHAARLGVDAIGLVFYEKSPRYVTPTSARVIVDGLSPFVTTVGLFVNADEAWVREVLDVVRLDLLQFHGDEPVAYCEQFALPYIKALRMRDDINVTAFAQQYASAQGLLLDTYEPGVAGGTGRIFDWNRIPSDIPLPVILAGGLNPSNVAEGIRTTRPYAVDVSGGIEMRKGVKDHARMTDFMKEVINLGTE